MNFKNHISTWLIWHFKRLALLLQTIIISVNRWVFDFTVFFISLFEWKREKYILYKYIYRGRGWKLFENGTDSWMPTFNNNAIKHLYFFLSLYIQIIWFYAKNIMVLLKNSKQPNDWFRDFHEQRVFQIWQLYTSTEFRISDTSYQECDQVDPKWNISPVI